MGWHMSIEGLRADPLRGNEAERELLFESYEQSKQLSRQTGRLLERVLEHAKEPLMHGE